MDSGKKPDYAKVTEGMACCGVESTDCPDDCPYRGSDEKTIGRCFQFLALDGLALVREQAEEIIVLRKETKKLNMELATANRSLGEFQRRARTLKAVTVMPREWAEASPEFPERELKDKLINALWDEKIIGLRKFAEGEYVRMVAVLQALKWDDEEGGTDGEERHRQVEGSDERDIGGHA